MTREPPSPEAEPGALGELKKTLLLAAPIMAGHVGQMLMGLVDTLMIGQVGVAELAASALANNLFHIFMVFGLGLLTSVSVVVANAYGSQEKKAAGEALRHGLQLAFLSGLLVAAAGSFLFPLLSLMGQEPEVVEKGKPYLVFLLLSLPFIFVQMAGKNFSESVSSPWPAFWTSLIAIGANVFLNWVFIFGNLGAPAMGLTGAGLATLLARIMGLLLLFLWLRYDPFFRPWLPDKWLLPFDFPALWHLFRLGFPMALQILFEVLIFSVTAIVIGVLGVVPLAAHQIAITCAATTFMFPLGLGMALTIRVSQTAGARQWQRLQTICRTTFLFTIAQALVFALGYILFRDTIAGFFTTSPEVATLAAQLLFLAACFQIVDGLQTTAMGALRGLRDMKIPTLLTFGAYWVISFPLGVYLGFFTPLGARGFWIAFCVGLGLVAISLLLRLRQTTASFPGPIDNTDLD
ncbi:MAG: MATE family efflux transporter [Opitutales bacterium]|nr:MATE family efflux transporter [Opitutales bacterium]